MNASGGEPQGILPVRERPKRFRQTSMYIYAPLVTSYVPPTDVHILTPTHKVNAHAFPSPVNYPSPHLPLLSPNPPLTKVPSHPCLSLSLPLYLRLPLDTPRDT